MSDIRDQQTYAIIGAAMEVHTILKHGFLEPVYQDALEKEFIHRGIPFEREKVVPVFYKGDRLASYYKTDFICYGSVIVEVKALSRLSGIEDSQLLNYLRATGLTKGLLLNFGETQLRYKRLVFNHTDAP